MSVHVHVYNCSVCVCVCLQVHDIVCVHAPSLTDHVRN